MKHKYIRELFPDHLPFPYSEEDYNDFDKRDTSNMDHTLIMWLYERLRYFQDEVSQDIDMECEPLYLFGEKVLIDNNEVNLRQCIDIMVDDCKLIMSALYESVEENWTVAEAAKNDLFKVLSKVYWAMWW